MISNLEDAGESPKECLPCPAFLMRLYEGGV